MTICEYVRRLYDCESGSHKRPSPWTTHVGGMLARVTESALHLTLVSTHKFNLINSPFLTPSKRTPNWKICNRFIPTSKIVSWTTKLVGYLQKVDCNDRRATTRIVWQAAYRHNLVDYNDCRICPQWMHTEGTQIVWQDCMRQTQFCGLQRRLTKMQSCGMHWS